MRSSFALIVIAACTSQAGAPPPPPHHPVGAAPTVHGSVAVAAAGRCGGAAPPPEYRPPQPAPSAGAQVLVRPGKTNTDVAPIAELTTGTDGRFEAPVAPGTYCLVLADKRTAPSGQPAQYTDASCLASYFAQCDAVVEVPQAQEAAIVRYTPCFGVCYQGPMPP